MPATGDEDVVHLRVEIAEGAKDQAASEFSCEPEPDSDGGRVTSVEEAMEQLNIVNEGINKKSKVSVPLSKCDKNTAKSIF